MIALPSTLASWPRLRQSGCGDPLIRSRQGRFPFRLPPATALRPSRKLITGVICGVRVEEIEDPLMQEIRYLDKLVDELARGKVMEKILRTL